MTFPIYSPHATRARLGTLAIAVILATQPLPSWALFGGGGGVGGATEVTQMLNHAELITNAQNAITTATNTLRQVQQLDQQLQNLPAGAVALILGNASPDLKAALGLYQQMNATQTAYQQLQQRLGTNMQAMTTANLTPSQFFTARAQLAQQKGGIYQAQISADQQAMQNAQEQAQALDRMISANSQISSEVGGLQAVANSNVQVIGAIQGMQNTLLAANAAAAQEKLDTANADALSATNRAATATAIQQAPRVTVQYPDPASTGYAAQPLTTTPGSP